MVLALTHARPARNHWATELELRLQAAARLQAVQSVAQPAFLPLVAVAAASDLSHQTAQVVVQHASRRLYAVEMRSASRVLSWSLCLNQRRCGPTSTLRAASAEPLRLLRRYSLARRFEETCSRMLLEAQQAFPIHSPRTAQLLRAFAAVMRCSCSCR